MVIFHNKNVCFAPLSCTLRCYNLPCQFTAFKNLRSLILVFTRYGWLRNWTLPEEFESHGAEQN
jgi:hypothetical protein